MTDAKTIAMFHTVCNEVIRQQPNDVAVAYALHGLKCSDADATHSQALYLSCNLTFWRHPNAKACRQALRDIIKALEPVAH